MVALIFLMPVIITLVWLSTSIKIRILMHTLKFLLLEVLAICMLYQVNDTSFLSCSTKIMAQTTRDLREQTGIVMGREIDTISKMGRELRDLMEEEVGMMIMEIGETRNLAGPCSDGFLFFLFGTY